jgi:hypothetical protein
MLLNSTSVPRDTVLRHGWLLKRDEFFLRSYKKARRLSGGGNRPALPPKVEDILKGLILEQQQEGN